MELKRNKQTLSICPKCKREILGYPALSRLDNKTEICSTCGMIEALEVYKNEQEQRAEQLQEYNKNGKVQ